MVMERQTAGVEVGQRAPDFEAWNLQDQRVSLNALIAGRKALLLFYRGGWCPFCNRQLAAIAQDHDQFNATGAAIVAVSGEEVEKGKELLKKLNLPFMLLSDSEFDGINRYGVRDPSPSELVRARAIMKLSKPAAFIIDETGVVQYKYVGKNAQDRPRNEYLLRVLHEI